MTRTFSAFLAFACALCGWIIGMMVLLYWIGRIL